MDLSNFIFHSDDTSDLDLYCLLSRLIPIMTKLNHILIIDIRYEQKGCDPFFCRTRYFTSLNLQISRCKDFLCCVDFGACGDVCGGGCAVGGRGDVSGSADAGDGIDVRDNNAFSEIGDGAALKVQWGW